MDLGRKIAELESRLARVENSPRLSHAAIDDTSLEVRDGEGRLRGLLGVQGDGTTAVNIVNGPPPPSPTVPIVAPVLGGVTASWDGRFAGGAVIPMDWARVEVHASAVSGFAPDPSTLVSTIETAQGATVVVPCDADVYVRLVARTTSGTPSVPSGQAGPAGPTPVVADDILDGIVTETKLADDAVTAAKLATGAVDRTALQDGAVLSEKLADAAVKVGKIADGAVTEPAIATDAVTARTIAAGAVTAQEVAAGAITTDKLTVTGGANLLSDPSFEGPYTVALVADAPDWAVDSIGNGSAKSLRVNAASPSPATKSLQITKVPILPGDQLFVAADYLTSADYTGSVRIFAQWEDSTGTTLDYGVAIASPLVVGGSEWTRFSATVTAPPRTVQATIWAQSFQAAAGMVWYDNAVVRPVMAGVQIQDGAITTPKLVVNSILGDRIATDSLDASKITAATITGREIKALSIKSDQLDANSVTAGKIAAGAVETPHISVGAVRPDQIAVGQGTNLVPDPSFESAATANVIAARGAPWAFAPGNRTGVGILCDLTADTPTSYTLPLATVPVLPGAQFWLGTDILVSDDYTAQAVRILARWENVAGEILGYGIVETMAPEPGRWQRIAGQVAAPQGTVQAVLCLEATAATSGWAVWDNAEATTIFGRVVGGSRAEVGPQGMRLYDDTGEESVSLVTGQDQYLTLRSGGTSVATIDDQGNASFADVNVAGALTVGGESISAFLGDRPRGMLAIDYQSGSVTASTSELGFVELAFESEPERMYRIVFEATADPSVAGGEIQLRLRDGKASKPTISSPQIQAAIHPMPLPSSQRVRLEWTGAGRGIGVGLHRLLITFRCSGGPAGQTVDLFGTTSMMGVLYVEDIGPHVPETGGYNNGGGTEPDPARKYTRTYTASWSGSYANRSGYNAYYGNKCMQGYYSGTSGIQASLIGFPASLSTDLAGAVIEKAEVYLYADHWYNAAGGSAVIKAHSHASRPAKFSSDAESKTVAWRRNEGKWVDITSVFDSTTWRGIALDPNSTNRAYYGSIRGAGQTYPPKLRVTYVK